CGICDAGPLATCNAGICECIPDCSGKNCGADGCGGSCGLCAPGDECNFGGTCQVAGLGQTCGASYVVTALPFSASDSTANATSDYGFASGECPGANGGGGASSDHAYAFTPIADGQYIVALAEAGFDSALYVLTDCADTATTCQGADDQFPGNGGESLTLDLTAGTTYYVIVDGWSNGSNVNGTYTLTVEAAPCAPSCTGLDCGDDGCGGSCGDCALGEACNAGICECVADCAGLACGDDGCGGSCGDCAGSEVCNAGVCECTPDCTGLVCGDDGCGGSCGDCGAGQACNGPGTECVETLDLSGYAAQQTDSARTFTFPAGSVYPVGTVIVLGRSAERAAFEGFWGAMPAGAVYINSGLPSVNGDETFAIEDGGGAVIDGPTISVSSGNNYQLNTPTGAPGAAGSWTTASATAGNGTPGVATVAPDGIRITEFSDASGTGNFIYEFVEISVKLAPVVSVTFDDVSEFFRIGCGACHGGASPTAGSGSQSIGSPDIAVAYAASQLTTNNGAYPGTVVGQAAHARILDGSMPTVGCTTGGSEGDFPPPCITAAEQDVIQDWIDGGMLPPL
ncbi:MAG: hypothetical protein ACI9OJ_002832, partial [Myxococcota bacterium]